jgi:hypothetical protein
VGHSHRGPNRNPIEISVRLPKSELAWGRALDLPRHGRRLRRAILGIHVLVVAQFGSVRPPLVILTPSRSR